MKKLHGEIILVDDDEFELNLLNETLSNLYYEATVKYFNNARDGYGYIKETNNNIFLIICDIQMHPVSGFKLKETIENDPECDLFLFMCYLYILYSESANIYYVGQSEDPWLRFLHHNTAEKDTFSSKHRPWKLMAIFEAGIRSDAMKIEKFIKKQKSRKLIEQLIQPDFIPSSSLAQLVRVPHVRD